MSKRGGKTKSGEPQLKEPQDRGEPPLIQESPSSGRDAAVKSPAGSSPITEEDGAVQSEHADGREEVGGGRSSQASEENSTPNKKKKAKQGREGEQKDGVMEGAEQSKRNRSASFFNRLKKRSHGSQPILSPNEAQRPQRRHTPSEGSSENEVFTNGGSTSRDGIKKISVDSQGAGVSAGLKSVADLELQVEQLNDDVKVAESQKYKELVILRAELERNIGELQEENAKQRDQIRELLEQQKGQEVEKVPKRKEILDNEFTAQEEEEKHQMEVTELETLKKELEDKQNEAVNSHNEIEAPKDRYADEMKVAKAEHERVLTELQHKTETLHDKESDKETEGEIAQLSKKLETQTEKLDDDKDTCALPVGPIKDEIQKLKNELEEAQIKLEESKVDLAAKDKEVDRLNHELENAEAKHIEELQSELERKDAQHAEEMDHLKADYEEKRKQDGQLIEQQVQKEVDRLERASRTRRLDLKNENETLKEKLEQKEHEKEACIDSMKSINAQRQKEYEKQLKAHREDIKSLNEQLRSQQQKADYESEKIKQELMQRESELAAAQEEYDKLLSDHKQLQSEHNQLGVMLKLRKYEEASAAASADWIHSSEDGMESEMSRDNLTDTVETEEADLQRQLSETQGELSKRDERIKELDRKVENLEHQLIQVKQEHFQAELGDPVDSASDTKGKMISYSKFSKLRQSYSEVVERLTELKERHDKVKRELTEKLEERQKELESERQLPQTHRSFSSESQIAVEDMDHETAVQEVGRLRLIVDEKEKQVLSLTTQVQSFNETAAERQELEKHTMDWKRKFETLEAENSQLKESNNELAKKIKKHEVLQKEFDAAEENIKREQQMVNDQKGTILNLQHEIKHLEDQLKGYDSMHAEVTHLKESAGGMLRRLWSLLGKNEGDCSMGFEELTKKMDELMSEVEAQKLQAQVYKDDFEAERQAREEAAGKKVEEIAEMQKLYSETVEERDSAQEQLAKALDELQKAQKELEDSKKLLQDTIADAAKNVEDLTAAHEKEMNAHVEDTEKIVEHNQKEMKAELTKRDQRITNLEEERDQLARDRDQLRENRDEVKRERDDLKKENEALDDQRKAKEKEAELNGAQKNELQNEVQQLRSVIESLQTEIQEVKEQLTVTLADKEALSDESLAKTQQVKQYKKQVDNFRIQLAESNARIEQCEQQINNLRIQLAESNSRIEQYQTRLHRSESDLEYCRRDLQAREEDGESKVEIVIAQHESEMSALNSELGRLRREKADVEELLRQLQVGTMQPDVAGLVDTLEREKSELNHKYTQLRDRFDGVWQHNDQLQAALKKHNIPVPMPRQMPGAAVSRSPQAQHLARQMGQEGSNAAPKSLDQYHATPRDGEPDKSITSPAAIGQRFNQPPDFTPQHQLVMAGGSSVSHHGMQHQYQHGYAGQGGTMVAPGQQNQYQQGQGYQVWHQGHQGGGVAPDCHQGQQAIRDHPGDQQNQIPQHGMGNANGTGIPGMEPQQLAVATEESGQRRVPSGPQENPLLQGINTEMHQVAAVVGREVDSNPALQSLSPQAPLDPNLVCPMCRQQFRIGEIQKYRQHVKHCHGT